MTDLALPIGLIAGALSKSGRIILAACILTGLTGGRTLADGMEQWLPSQPLVEGQRTFQDKFCSTCHGLPGDANAARVAPDLGQVRSWRDTMQLTSSLWNHTPKMIEKMRERGIARPVLSPDEMGKLVAYLFYLNFSEETGDPARGHDIFEQRTCARCHQLAGRGGTVGPRLDELNEAITSSFLAQALWNHGPEMAAKMKDLGIERPHFEANDVADIVALIRGGATPLAPLVRASAAIGSPRAGRAVFNRKGCVRCHAVAGVGGTTGPDLSKVAPARNISEMAGEFWNHGPMMWDAMRTTGVAFSKLSDRDMADLIAYLYFVRYTGRAGDAAKGAAIFKDKGCARCHADGGQENKPAPNLVMSKALETALHWSAAMWNHAATIDNAVRESHATWPTFEDDEMSDLVAYLQSRRGSK
ncbi:MAG: c-type cytochrome [Deltaproteobacteria bacterium]|nr:c-type cytochrome [Deltaproteobacteria bacterium]